MVDWDTGNYEATARDLAPVAHAVVERARISAGADVVDIACGTGNAALVAASRGARVVGVDGAPRLLEVARNHARAQGMVADFRERDLLTLPVDDDAADVILSVFGMIFAHDPRRAMQEVARILRPTGRALITAWIPGGPIDAMIDAIGGIVGRVSPAERPKRFPWSDSEAVSGLAVEAGLVLESTTPNKLAIRAASPEAYFASAQEHPLFLEVQPPLFLEVQPVIERAGLADEVREVAMGVLREAKEDPGNFLVHTRTSFMSYASDGAGQTHPDRPPPARHRGGSFAPLVLCEILVSCEVPNPKRDALEKGRTVGRG